MAFKRCLIEDNKKLSFAWIPEEKAFIGNKIIIVNKKIKVKAVFPEITEDPCDILQDYTEEEN